MTMGPRLAHYNSKDSQNDKKDIHGRTPLEKELRLVHKTCVAQQDCHPCESRNCRMEDFERCTEDVRERELNKRRK